MRYGCSVSFGWAGYRYFAPVAGFVADHSGGGFAIHSRQGAEINLAGSYHCWNRVYSPYLGRWTTPDPLASPWWNLWDYVGNQSVQSTDPSGLEKSPYVQMLGLKSDKDKFNELYKTKYKGSIHNAPPKNANNITYAWQFKGSCGPWVEVRSSDWQVSSCWPYVDIQWCCKAYRRKCEGSLIHIQIWSQRFKVAINLVGGNNPHDPDESSLLRFDIEFGKGSQEIGKIDGIVFYGWRKECHCFKKWDKECKKKDNACDKIKPPDDSTPPHYLSFSDSYDQVKTWSGVTTNTIGIFGENNFADKRTMNVDQRPTDLGGDCGWGIFG